MDKHHVIAARNHSYEGMLAAQFMQDSAKNKREAFVADSVYYAFWSCYSILCELEKMEMRKAAETGEGPLGSAAPTEGEEEDGDGEP